MANFRMIAASGELVCLLGRNGAGKTTTMRSIMSLTPPKTGGVKFYGEDLTTGVRHGGNRFYMVMKDKPGVTGEVLEIIKKNGFTIDSVLTTYEGVQKGYKRVVVRTIGKGGDLKKAQGELKTHFGEPLK